MPNLINYKNDNWAISRNSENEVVFIEKKMYQLR